MFSLRGGGYNKQWLTGNGQPETKPHHSTEEKPAIKGKLTALCLIDHFYLVWTCKPIRCNLVFMFRFVTFLCLLCLKMFSVILIWLDEHHLHVESLTSPDLADYCKEYLFCIHSIPPWNLQFSMWMSNGHLTINCLKKALDFTAYTKIVLPQSLPPSWMVLPFTHFPRSKPGNLPCFLAFSHTFPPICVWALPTLTSTSLLF